MRSPDEIKKGLECGADTCNIRCPYWNDPSCTKNVHVNALAYIQQLEAQNAELLTRVKQLEAKCHQLERERDELVAEFKAIDCPCNVCKHLKKSASDAPCNSCIHILKGEKSCFEWRGAKED